MHEIGIEWMTQTEVNGHFLELRGIPDEKLEWERIPEAIAGANYYNIQNIPGQLTVEPDSGKIYLKIQYVTGADIRRMHWDGIWKKKWRKSVNGWHF